MHNDPLPGDRKRVESLADVLRRRAAAVAPAPPAAEPAPRRAAPPPIPPTDDDEHESHGFAIDRVLHAAQGRLTAGLSPAGLAQAFADWSIHLANEPGKQADLVRKWLRKLIRLAHFAAHAPFDPATPLAIEPLPEDRRFRGPDWQRLPHALVYQSFLMVQQWWHNATTGVRGVDPRHAAVVHFTMRQILDALSPANFPATNPEVLRVTFEQGGRNMWNGLVNWAEDMERGALGRPPVGAEKFRVGETVAATPGQVVFRNQLMELIQYSPDPANALSGDGETRVYPEPVLILPAWLMKYYILDLSPENSLVRYLLGRGHTVFMVSWKNPGPADRDLGLDDYLRRGALAALDAVRAIAPGKRVHGVGYCLGGTLLALAAAKLASERDESLRTIAVFAGQVDFSEAGELMLFINDSQVAYLEDMMWDRGYLDTRQMAGAFQLLRSNDLVWSSMVRQYMLGERPKMTDLMAWNGDATRMPYRMHSEYLRRLFLGNDLAAGRYRVDERPVSLADIRAPVFAVSTTKDHIAPWKSVYKLTQLTQSDVTFVLASGGHNAGIVSPPLRADREFWIGTVTNAEPWIDALGWRARATRREGSWWIAWTEWLEAYSGDPVPPPPMGTEDGPYAPLGPAPGSYVRAP